MQGIYFSRLSAQAKIPRFCEESQVTSERQATPKNTQSRNNKQPMNYEKELRD